MKDAVIIGAGLAGLSCARELLKAGLTLEVVEAGGAVGGRVRTDVVDGFLLDRGFQVLLTAYPEAKRQFDYEQLELRNFDAGALVWNGGRFHRFADPFRTPLKAMETLFDPVVPFRDKLLVARLRARVSTGSLEDLLSRPESRSREYLRTLGFSGTMIDRFFSPFFGGVFLETELNTSSRWLEYLFRLFAQGATAVPQWGMQRIPEQMASHLPEGSLRLNVPVARLGILRGKKSAYTVTLASGEVIEARAVVLAVNAFQAEQLVVDFAGESSVKDRMPSVAWNATTCYYFAAEHNVVEEPIVLLNGEGAAAGPVNNACVISNVSPAYAPPGSHLVSASVIGPVMQGVDARDRLEAEVRSHLSRWFGADVQKWKCIGVYPIPRALPKMGRVRTERRPITVDAGMVASGDFCETASIQGALTSGMKAAALALQFLG